MGGGLLAHLLLADAGYVAVRAGRQLSETTIPVFRCSLEAPDAESVRFAQQEAGLPADAVWAFERASPEIPRSLSR